MSDEERLKEARKVVDEQAKDEGLWFDAVYITESMLQQALRRLHAAVEGKTPEEIARAILKDR
jgi:hypothetical protein